MKRILVLIGPNTLLYLLAGVNLAVDVTLRLRFVPAWSATWHHLHMFEDSLYRASAEEPAWYLVLLFANVSVFALIVLRGDRPNLRTLLILGAGVRVASLGSRIVLGESIDPDLANIYFGYAHTFAGGEYPLMEYPQLALLFFTLVYQLAAGDQGLFLILFPLSLIPAELVIIFCIYRLGEEFRNASTGSVAAAFYALSPFTLIFWFEKFDVLPTALLVLGVYLFIKERYVASAASLAAGVASKWIPALAVPVLLVSLLKEGSLRKATSFAIALVVVGSALLLPFWMFDGDRFLYTYDFQLQRGLIGESLFFIPSYFLTLAGQETALIVPWVEQPSAFSNGFMMSIQGGVILASWLFHFSRPSDRRRDVIQAMLSVVVFILLNRVYSPQFVLFVLAGYLVAFSSLVRSKGVLFLCLSGCSVFSLANFMVWPMYVRFWFQSNIVFFGLALMVWLGLFVASFQPAMNRLKIRPPPARC